MFNINNILSIILYHKIEKKSSPDTVLTKLLKYVII